MQRVFLDILQPIGETSRSIDSPMARVNRDLDHRVIQGLSGHIDRGLEAVDDLF